MIVTVSFPIVDPRKLRRPGSVNPLPDWRTAGQHLRGFGEIWSAVPNDGVLEPVFCDCPNAIRFGPLPRRARLETAEGDALENAKFIGAHDPSDRGLSNRRLYCDGRITARCEASFEWPHFDSRGARRRRMADYDAEILRQELLEPLLRDLLATSVEIAKTTQSPERAPLREAGPALARAFQRATAAKGADPGMAGAGAPAIVVELREERLGPPLPGGRTLHQWASGRLERLFLEIGGRLPVYVLRETGVAPRHELAILRQALTRFHAYAEAAKALGRLEGPEPAASDLNLLETLAAVYEVEERMAAVAGRIDPGAAALAGSAPGASPLAITDAFDPQPAPLLVALLRPRAADTIFSRLRRWRLLGRLFGLDPRYEAFISYRRKSIAAVQRIHAELEKTLGPDRVFFDLAQLQPGDHFPTRLMRALIGSRSVVAVIGKNWIGQRSNQNHLDLDRPGDWVLRELDIALKHKKKIVPVLIDRDRYPKKMPDRLLEMLSVQHIVLNADSPEFEDQIRKVIEVIRAAR